MGHDATEEFCCSVIYRNVDAVKTKQLGTSDCTRTQLSDVVEKIYVKIGGGGGKGLRGYSYPQITVVCALFHAFLFSHANNKGEYFFSKLWGLRNCLKKETMYKFPQIQRIKCNLSRF